MPLFPILPLSSVIYYSWDYFKKIDLVYFLFTRRIASDTVLGDQVPNIRFLLAWPPPYIKDAVWLRIENTEYKNLALNVVYCRCHNMHSAYFRCQFQVCICMCLNRLQYILILMGLMWLYASVYIDGFLLYSVPKGCSERRQNVSEIWVLTPYIAMCWVWKLFLFIQNALGKQFISRMYWECFICVRNLVSNTKEAIHCCSKIKLRHQCCITKTIFAAFHWEESNLVKPKLRNLLSSEAKSSNYSVFNHCLYSEY